MYLIAVFVLSTGAGGGLGLVAYDVYRSVARTMLVLMSVGVCALWPLVRLSQATPERIWRAAWQDFVVVVVPLLLICLPQSASWMADWPLEVSIRLWMCLTLWAVAVSMLIACAQRRGWSPAVSTMVCLLVCFGGALFAVFPPAANGGAIGVEVVGFRELVSAPTALLEMTQDRSWSGLNARITDRHWLALVPPGLAALVFGLTGVFAPGERRA
ncbi:MAG: hypothetical protein PSX37_00590 [bacterium]|nr:hypothetical protein [bacterium]